MEAVLLAFPGHAGRRAGTLRWRSGRLPARSPGRSLALAERDRTFW